jgi:murein DD-endopeptidase MepM/ murein hydrolase activator NlpD
LPDRLRRASQRAAILAVLALVVVAPVALAAGPEPVAPREIPEPRVMVPGEASGFRLPFEAGIDVRIDQGWNTGFSHNGRAAFAYDFGMYEGTPVLASASGVVTYAHAGETACGGPELRNHANYVTIDHADGSATQYGHLLDVSVEVGEVISAGQRIGRSGMTGYTNCLQHLHFARQSQGGPVTASVPVYFAGYADREFHSGEVITASAPACVAPTDLTAAASSDASFGSSAGTSAGTTAGASSHTAAGKASVSVSGRVSAPAAERTVEPEPPLGAFCGAYFNGLFDGPALFTREDGSLNFDWRKRGPGGYWLDDPVAGYSARWSGRFSFPSYGRYTIAIIAAGGVRVSIDGLNILSRWTDRGHAVEVVLTRGIGAGIHRIDVEHFTTSGQGVLKIGWGRLFTDG